LTSLVGEGESCVLSVKPDLSVGHCMSVLSTSNEAVSWVQVAESSWFTCVYSVVLCQVVGHSQQAAGHYDSL